MRRLAPILAIVCATACLYACKPNEKAQTQQWQNNAISVQGFGQKYPSTRRVLDARLAQAKSAWAKAEQEPDKEKRSELMQQVNASVTDATGGLNSLDGRLQTIERMKAEPRLRKLPRNQVEPAVRRVDDALSRAEHIVMASEVVSVEDLQARTKAANGELISGMAPLANLLKKK